jgi:hypothetical protein
LTTIPGDAVTYTVPAGTDLIEIKYTAGILWMNPNEEAGAPSGGVTDGTASEPVGWGQTLAVRGGEELSFQNDEACWVIISRRNN